MEYTVIKAFTDKEDANHAYAVGNPYPRKGTASAERIALLSSTDNDYKQAFIQSAEDDAEAFPKHVGGGYYELSNGERVKGKSAASKAEKAVAK